LPTHADAEDNRDPGEGAEEKRCDAQRTPLRSVKGPSQAALDGNLLQRVCRKREDQDCGEEKSEEGGAFGLLVGHEGDKQKQILSTD